MYIVAMTTRSWPNMMSSVMRLIASLDSPSKRSAAFSIIPGSVEMPTVNVDGTSMRMFCRDSASRNGMSIVIGVRSRNW